MKRWMPAMLVIIITIGFILIQGGCDYNVPGRFSRILAESVNEQIVEMTGHTERSVGEIELILRKCAHLVEYLVLGTVVFIAVMTFVESRILAYLIVALMTVPVPFVDEFIVQGNTTGRAVHLLDVYLDLLGIFMAIGIGSLYFVLVRVREVMESYDNSLDRF